MFIYSKLDKLIELKQISISGITIKQMAKEMDIPISTLNNIKSGLAVPGVDKLETIARYFGVDMNYFFDIPTAKKVEQETSNGFSPDYFLERLEKQAVKISKLEEELAFYKGAKPSYSMPDVQDSKVAETQIKLGKTDQPQPK